MSSGHSHCCGHSGDCDHSDDCSGEECLVDCCCSHGHRNDVPEKKERLKLTYIKKGDGDVVGNDGSEVEINYTLKFANNIVEEKNNYVFIIGDSIEKIICDGIELMVEYMHVGDICECDLLPKYAFGDVGDEERGIPKNAMIQARVELVRLNKFATPFVMSGEDLYPFAQRKKDEGNTFFKNKMFSRAIRAYQCGLEYLEEDYRIPKDVVKSAFTLRHVLHTNLCAVYLNQNQFENVILHASIVIKEDKTNWKALLRRGAAYLKKLKLDKARADLEAVLELQPTSADALRELQTVKELQKKEQKKEQNVYQKMF
ncbi:peptidylprolyl isomerase [Entamoeba marina]